MTALPLVTVVVPSFNQGQYLGSALESIFAQTVPMEVFVMDGGSTDESVSIIEAWNGRLAGWRSAPDQGQAAAINEGVALGSAPFIYWLNSDDLVLPGALALLIAGLKAETRTPAAYGRVWNQREPSMTRTPVWVEPFNVRRLAIRCIISQPGVLIRRSAWDDVGGLDSALGMAMDYDLWWRLFKNFGAMKFLGDFVAVNRDHQQTKTRSFRRQHYEESIAIVKKYNGRVPAKWWLYRPYAVWWKSGFQEF